VQLIPALTNTPGGTCVMWMLTGMRCASRTHSVFEFAEGGALLREARICAVLIDRTLRACRVFSQATAAYRCDEPPTHLMRGAEVILLQTFNV
jgi:hypothetical protein